MEKLADILVSGVFLGIFYGFIALSFVFVFKSTKVLNLAGGWMMCLFPYLGYFLCQWFPSLPFPVTVVIVLVSAALVGMAVERFIMRPLIGQPILAPVIATLALAFIINGIILLFSKGYPGELPHFLPEGVWKIGPVAVSYAYVVAAIAVILLFSACILFYRRTTMGIVLRAVAEDTVVAGTTGISVTRALRFTWIVGCVLSALGGLMLAGLYGFVGNELAEYAIAKGLPVILVGGLESVPGALVGGLIVGISELLGGGYIDELVGGGFREVTPFILMLLILLIRPFGIFGEERIERI